MTLSDDQLKTFGIDTPTCAWTGEAVQVGFGALGLWEQALHNLNNMQWRLKDLEARIAPETIALSRLQRDFKEPPPSPPGFVYIHVAADDVRKQEELLALLAKERDELAARIKTARAKMGLDKK